MVIEEDDDIVELQSPNGKTIKFVEIAGIAHSGKFYAILKPVDELPGMPEDYAIVFRVSRGEDGSDRFDVETDDNIINAVFKKYEELLDNAQKDKK